MTEKQIVQSIGALSERINDLGKRLDDCLNALHEISTANIETNADGIDGLATTVEEQNTALNDLAMAVAELEG